MTTDWVMNVLNQVINRDRKMFELLMALISDGDILSADDFYKVTRRIFCVWGCKYWSGLYNEIIFMMLTNKRSHDVLFVFLERLARAKELLCYPPSGGVRR